MGGPGGVVPAKAFGGWGGGFAVVHSLGLGLGLGGLDPPCYREGSCLRSSQVQGRFGVECALCRSHIEVRKN